MKAFFSIAIVVVCIYGLVFSDAGTTLKTVFFSNKVHVYKTTELKSLAHLAAVLHDVDPTVFIAQIQQESNFNPNARSKAGAIGIAQIMSTTAKGWKVNPNDPLQSLDVAAKHMGSYVKTYRRNGHDEITSYKMALAAYNAGPGAVAKYHDVPPYDETRNYVKRILSQR